MFTSEKSVLSDKKLIGLEDGNPVEAADGIFVVTASSKNTGSIIDWKSGQDLDAVTLNISGISEIRRGVYYNQDIERNS